jgi:hypothetical protein
MDKPELSQSKSQEGERKITNLSEAFAFYIGKIEDDSTGFILKANLGHVLKRVKIGELTVDDPIPQELFDVFSQVYANEISQLKRIYSNRIGFLYSERSNHQLDICWQALEEELNKPIEENDHSLAVRFYQKELRSCLANIFSLSYNLSSGEDISGRNHQEIKYEEEQAARIIFAINSLSNHRPNYTAMDLTIIKI